MRVGIIQSNYIPWRGYFDLIDDVDLFVFYDDVQYTTGDWRNRNKIKTPRGPVWLTVPVLHQSLSQRIYDTAIDYSQSWQRRHAALIQENYSKAPFYDRYAGEYFAILEKRYQSISQLNTALARWVVEKLSITTTLHMSSEFKSYGSKTDRLISLLRQAGATSYLSGPAGRDYIEVEKFAAAGIELRYKSYVYGEYPQLWGSFEQAVTILDLLFNCGECSRKYLKSLHANDAVQVVDFGRDFHQHASI